MENRYSTITLKELVERLDTNEYSVRQFIKEGELLARKSGAESPLTNEELEGCSDEDFSSLVFRKSDVEHFKTKDEKAMKLYQKIRSDMPNKIKELENLKPKTVTEVLEKERLLKESYDELLKLNEKYISEYGDDILAVSLLGEEVKQSAFKAKNLGEQKENEKLVSEKAYRFLKEGPTWKIEYDGKSLVGLKGNGFEIIHYLVSTKRSFHTSDLAIEFDKHESEKKKYKAIETHKWASQKAS